MNDSDLNLEFGLQSDLFWDPLGQNEVKAAAQHGFSFFEIWAHPPWFDIYSASAASETKSVVEDNGMRIRSVHSPCEGDWDISSESDRIRERSVHEVILSIEHCRDMGGELVVVHPGRAVLSRGEAAVAEEQRRIGNSIRSLKNIQQAAADHGMRIAVENQWSTEVGSKEPHFLQLLDTLDPRICGLCFDSSHANITPGTLELFRKITHPIITTHLSDNHGTYDEHRPPFTALVDWPVVIRLILDNGFRGPWLLEVTNGGNDPLEVLGAMGASLEKLKDLIVRISKNV